MDEAETVEFKRSDYDKIVNIILAQQKVVNAASGVLFFPRGSLSDRAVYVVEERLRKALSSLAELEKEMEK